MNGSKVRTIYMEIFATVLSGVTIFVVGQIIQQLIIEPYLQYKKVVGEIDNKLKFYSNIMTNGGLKQELVIEVIDALRQLSCDLESSYKMMLVRIGPSKEDISKAATCLIFLSNSTGINNNQYSDIGVDKITETEDKVRKILGIQKL